MPDVFVKHKNTKTPQPHDHPFATFCSHPQITFQNQDPDEKILLLLRRHFITNVPWIFFSLFFISIPIVINLFGGDFQSFLSFIPLNYFLVSIAFYYLLILSYILVNLMLWFYNIFLVTQKRIVDVDFSDIVYHNVAMTKLSLIEDVNYTQTGFLPSFFNYGNLFVQTAGEEKNFDAYAVPKPGDATEIIQNLIGGKEHV